MGARARREGIEVVLDPMGLCIVCGEAATCDRFTEPRRVSPVCKKHSGDPIRARLRIRGTLLYLGSVSSMGLTLQPLSGANCWAEKEFTKIVDVLPIEFLRLLEVELV